LRLFDEELGSPLIIRKDRERIRAQLDKFIVTQLWIGAPSSWLVGSFLRLAVWISFVLAPLLLLIAFQLRFLPYHSTTTTWIQRGALIADIILLWIMWPQISSGRTRPASLIRGWRWAWRTTEAFGCMLLVIFSTGVATIPDESMEKAEIRLGWPVVHVDTGASADRVLWWPTWLLFEGEPAPIRSRSTSLLGRNLVLIDQQLVEPDSDKRSKLSRTLSLRGRDLRYATLVRTGLQKADFTGAHLEGASLEGAQLLGASLKRAQLQGASLESAQLQGASLDVAQLQGAFLYGAQLQGASLDDAQLQGASLSRADLQGASLHNADLQGSSLRNADLQGASLGGASVWRTSFPQKTNLISAAGLRLEPMAPKRISSLIETLKNRSPRKTKKFGARAFIGAYSSAADRQGKGTLGAVEQAEKPGVGQQTRRP
jgi:uncharacterized protein YjbI with pentapeptide repeats